MAITLLEQFQGIRKKFAPKVDATLYKFVEQNVPKQLQQLCIYPLKDGKRFRPTFLFLTFKACGGNNIYDAMPAALAIELSHNYTLVNDDIGDNSELRRGKKTVWKEFGLAMALLCSMSLRELIEKAISKQKINILETKQIIHEVMNKMINTEWYAIAFKQLETNIKYLNEQKPPMISEQDYLELIEGKSASIIAGACKMGAVIANADRKKINLCEKFGVNAGIAHQLRDDVLDFAGKKDKWARGTFYDFEEGKLGNIIILRALNKLENPQILLNLLAKPKKNSVDFKLGKKLIYDTDAFDYANKLSARYVAQAQQILKKIDDGHQHNQDLQGMLNFMAKREV